MSVGTEEAGAPPKKETMKDVPSRKEATSTANKLLEIRVGDILNKYSKPDGKIDSSSMSTDESNLFAVAQYKAGFTKEEYSDAGEDGMVLNGGLVVIARDGQEFTISSLLDDNDAEDGLVYKALAEIDDPENPGTTKTIEVFVDADEVVRSHMAKRAESIAANFVDSIQKEGIKWLASGSTEDPPKGFGETAEAPEGEVDDPVKVADEIIHEEQNKIQVLVNNLKSKDKLTDDEKTELAKHELIIGKLKAFTHMVGDFAPMARFAAVQTLKDNGSEVEGLNDLQDLLEPGAAKGLKILTDKMINEGGATEDDIELIKQEGMNAFMVKPELLDKLSKIQGLGTLLFGKEMSTEEIMEKFGGALNDKQMHWLKENAGKTGGGLAALLLLLLAIPVVAAGSAVYMSANLSGAGGRR